MMEDYVTLRFTQKKGFAEAGYCGKYSPDVAKKLVDEGVAEVVTLKKTLKKETATIKEPRETK